MANESGYGLYQQCGFRRRGNAFQAMTLEL